MFPPIILIALQVPQAPVIPPGLNADFAQAAYAVEADLAAGSFDRAKQDAVLLPHPHIRFQWDDSKVPDQEKEGYRRARESAMAEWHTAVPQLDFEQSGTPDILFSFTGILPRSGGSLLPAGIDIHFQRAANPRMTYQIAIERMDPAESTLPSVIHNEVAFAIAQYLGIEEMSRYGGFASRSDQNTNALTACSDFEQHYTVGILSLVAKLNALIENKQKVLAGKPVMELSTGKIEGVKGYEDEPLQISFTVSNSGDSDLDLYVLPDCGCLAPRSPPSIKPHSSGTILADVNTEAFHTGVMEHSLLIYSNDPNWPIERVPVEMDIEPAYRFVQPAGQVYPLGPEGGSFDLYLAVSPHDNIPVLTASVIGVNAKVQFHEWSGIVPGDRDDKGPLSGYKFHIDVKPVHDFGLIPASLTLGTANAEFREISTTVNLQKGIVAMPGQVYFGTVSNKSKTIAFEVSSASGPFQIKSIESESPYFSAKVLPGADQEKYQVALTYSGNASVGLLQSIVKVHLSDPEQPFLQIRAEADVR